MELNIIQLAEESETGEGHASLEIRREGKDLIPNLGGYAIKKEGLVTGYVANDKRG